MKTLVLITALVASCFAAHAQDRVIKLKSGDSFEGADRGCMWSKDVGRCVVQNQFGVPVQCTVSIKATTAKGYKLGNVRRIRIDPYKYDDSPRVYVPHGDQFTSVSETADCTIE